jgi:hypothetical protein
MATDAGPSSSLEPSSDPRQRNHDPEDATSSDGPTGELKDDGAHGCGTIVNRRRRDIWALIL